MSARRRTLGMGSVLLAVLLATALGFSAGCSRAPSPAETRAWDAEIARLHAEQDSLRARAAVLLSSDSRLQNLPKGDVVIIVPTSFVRSVVERVISDVARSITLRITGIKAHVEKSVKKIVTIGDFTVDVNVREVVGKLEPGKPDVRFEGERITVALPVSLVKGRGSASIRFVWDGKHVAGVTCGDLDVTKEVSGNALPARYLITGSLGLALRGSNIVATPRFPETRIRIRVAPSKASWAAVDSLLAAHEGLCGWVLDKVNVPQILKGIVQEKGISVALPLKKLKPFVIPAGVRDTVSIEGRMLTVTTATNSIRIDSDAILYGADVTLK